MSLSKLKPAKGSIKDSKRIGRGNASGQGRTAGKGHKGYQSRSGTKNRFHFEGGQTPLMRRLPKRGFSNYGFRKVVQIVNLDRISKLGIDIINPEILVKNDVIKFDNIPVKILGNGNIDKPIEVTAHMFSKSAIEKLEKSGGKAIFQ
ncbi:50S ribosomal protein L15 [Candidatus Pelagibacter communis]|uniref:50S ribosomal protein L15 n=1 Tax=Pelagibacter ubique TaxID=198252 RepID=UPI00094C6F00|nr:50S ribosomal protein L15 [Candidatus Pelagibacter ubique]